MDLKMDQWMNLINGSEDNLAKKGREEVTEPELRQIG